ncbi:MAG TPA: hypothetical protein VE988_17960 [Gemmataceae bacterium]|nr:hypothetical protein [Gemmataceae bacterium]
MMNDEIEYDDLETCGANLADAEAAYLLEMFRLGNSALQERPQIRDDSYWVVHAAEAAQTDGPVVSFAVQFAKWVETEGAVKELLARRGPNGMRLKLAHVRQLTAFSGKEREELVKLVLDDGLYPSQLAEEIEKRWRSLQAEKKKKVAPTDDLKQTAKKTRELERRLSERFDEKTLPQLTQTGDLIVLADEIENALDTLERLALLIPKRISQLQDALDRLHGVHHPAKQGDGSANEKRHGGLGT